MLPPGTDFIIAYMDSLPVLAGSEKGNNWSQFDSLEQDFTRQGGGCIQESTVKLWKIIYRPQGLAIIGVPGGPATCHNKKQYCQQISMVWNYHCYDY